MGETSQPLHEGINGPQSDIAHRRTDMPPVAELFNSSAHPVLDMMLKVIELATSRDPCL